ncbi:nuclear transport factor 2 family protein [Ekhidna sp.]|uniref:nuclear transport factor 2 family protein n=1 Tax=Ekhidna sp. TaxID=2608089 RepID=UPI003CCBA5A2
MRNKTMKTFYLIITLLLISCGQKSSVDQVIEEGDYDILKNIKEVKWPMAYREQDTVLLDRLLAEDFQLIDQSGGRYGKKDELAWIKEHALAHDSFYYEIKRLDIYENGTAVIAGTGHIFNDTAYSTYESSNVLVKRNREWKAILSHVSGYKNIKAEN